MTSKFLNISTDTTLGGSSASDNTVASQKAVKSYVDNQYIPYGESTSAGDATQKEVTISEVTELNNGQIIIVKPTITSTVANSTIKLNNFTAYPMLYGTAAITTSTDSIVWAAGYPSWFRFDGSHWVFLGHGIETTYGTMSVSEGTTGTKTTARTVRADYLKQIIQGTKLTGLSTSTNSAVAETDTVLVGIGKLQAQVNGKQATITSSNKLSASLVSGLATVATSGSYNDLSNKPTIPTVYDATLTIQKNGSNVATFTANASSNVTANIEVPIVDQAYSATSTNAQSGVAVANAIAPKQDTLVSGTNIKTINGTSLLGSGNITIETSSTPNVDGTTISYNSSDALQTIAVKNVRDNSTLPIWHGTEYQWNHGDQTTWYYWQTSVTALWTSGGDLPSSGQWLNLAFGDGVFLTSRSEKTAYTTDNGTSWQAGGNLPDSSNDWRIDYGDNKFLAVQYFNVKSAYSTDGGVTWQTGGNLPSSESWYDIKFGNGRFVTVSYSSKSAYSTDGGVTWQAGGNLPTIGNWWCIGFGDGKFVAPLRDSTTSVYSTDGGVTWVSSLLPSSSPWMEIKYGNSLFVCITGFLSDSTAIFSVTYDKCYTDTANPTTTSVVYSAPDTVSALTISSVTSGAITLSNNNTYYYNQSGNVQTYDTIGNSHPEYLCFIDGVGVKMGNTMIATNNSNS